MNAELSNQIEEARNKLLRQASATLSVNRIVGVSGKRIELALGDRSIEIVYYMTKSENAPLLIGYHSGGWLFGGCALNDPMWKFMSEELDVNIASVGYRMAPKYKWKDSFDDAYDSAMYLYENSSLFGFDRNRIGLIGPSAGGNLAAAVCIKAHRDNKMIFSDLLLLYPLLDVFTEPELKGPEHYGGPAAYIMNEQHVRPEEAKDPLASPVFAENSDLMGFPDTWCFVAENDALKHEGRLFCEKLAEAGNKATCIQAEGMSHCYFELGFRDKLTDFEKGFIGPLGVETFESGDTYRGSMHTLQKIKKILNDKG